MLDEKTNTKRGKAKRSYGASVEWRKSKDGRERAVMRIRHQAKDGTWKWTRRVDERFIITPDMTDAQKRALRKDAINAQAKLRAEGQAAKADRVAWKSPAQIEREQQAAKAEQAEGRLTRLVPLLALARIEQLRADTETELDDMDSAERKRSELLKRRNLANRESIIRRLIDSATLADVAIDEITQDTVDEFVTIELAAWRKARGNRRSTGRRSVEMSLENLSAIQGHNKADRTWKKPAALKASGEHRKRIFTGQQLQTMYDGTDREFGVFLALCFFLGARPESEACRLRVSDVEFHASEKTYEGSDGYSVSVGARVHLRGELKTEASQRSVFVPQWLADDLERHCSGKSADAFIFTNRNGAAWTKNSYRKKWSAALALFDAGTACADGNDLAGAWIRDLRSCTSTALGVDLGDVTIDRVMGHSGDVRSRYRRIVDATLLEVLAILDGYWHGQSDTGSEYSTPRPRRTLADFAAEDQAKAEAEAARFVATEKIA